MEGADVLEAEHDADAEDVADGAAGQRVGEGEHIFSSFAILVGVYVGVFKCPLISYDLEAFIVCLECGWKE